MFPSNAYQEMRNIENRESEEERHADEALNEI